MIGTKIHILNFFNENKCSKMFFATHTNRFENANREFFLKSFFNNNFVDKKNLNLFWKNRVKVCRSTAKQFNKEDFFNNNLPKFFSGHAKLGFEENSLFTLSQKRTNFQLRISLKKFVLKSTFSGSHESVREHKSTKLVIRQIL